MVQVQSHVMERAADFAQLADRLERMASSIEETKDDATPGKLLQLAEKTRGAELNIAFCGHFSAGKSTMINTLLGASLLPSNPIPTSANVVKIRGGEKAARVYTHNNGVLTFDPDTEMEKLKQFAVDGDTVEWVEVSYPGTMLNEKASLLDTPGIDSTDAAHKIATESALHLADVVIYMMDYNHVQAEENFNFTKTLKDRGKPVYLVINMIDKHIDFELDFDSYKESVEEAFATWNIEPDGIFYTSLAEPDHEENQYEAFRALLEQLIADREKLVSKTVADAAEHLIEEHVQVLRRQNAAERQELETRLDELQLPALDSRDAGRVKNALQTAEEAASELASRVDKARKQMEKELAALLDNARLTYYSTNEAAEQYLESRKPGFKMGLFFSGKKTEEERARRLDVLLADLREKVAANLDFHFKELLSKFPEQFDLRDEAYHAAVYATTIEVTAEFLASHVKDGASTREYVMNYCSDISNGIKTEYRRAGLGLIDQVAALIRKQTEQESMALQKQLAVLRELMQIHARLGQLAAMEQAARQRLQAILREGA
ncbi:dynamin family protein [Brevibacillus borstelensis]|uniref:dynamin family protein n=1 Tax=Brevibacillus borstelensis TaxID=45462 RepID=UPI001D0A3352|nr:dynamin family protein [Brevibacillus borstelensis]MCC0565550.1 dynamin family protein [Brevibacillus borstelensis]MCM3468871.1 dynamin family protein [Brevibacillus borstelensis]MCM3559742.1 dynamin family protein [Brevibacillus borstelensis]MCM3621545.1 dynamin family protein [Brevibacillus borstelensis]WNF07055.1 dynamin family protein [Brevibacillus borstelensis]